MKNKALGMIETYGYLPSIEGADAALKAAKVELLKIEKTTGGLMTIYLIGDVSAVQSAVDAGSAAAGRVGQVVSTSVIPRMADQLDSIVYSVTKDNEEELIKEEIVEEIVEEVEEIQEVLEEKSDTIPERVVDFNGLEIDLSSEESLSSLRVTELRQLIRGIEAINMTNDQVKYGRKQELIDTLVEYGREGVVR